MQTNSTTALERQLIDLQAALNDASDCADRLDDTDTGFDIGCELLDARRAVQAALDALERATAPAVGPRFDATIVRSPVLDRAYSEIDQLFVA